MIKKQFSERKTLRKFSKLSRRIDILNFFMKKINKKTLFQNKLET
jgi:hypothetical protein